MKKDKLCIYCKFYIPETAGFEADCEVDNDPMSNEYCDDFRSEKESD